MLLVGEMLLSAVVGWTLYQVACGFGIVGIILGMLTSTSVLDLLYWYLMCKGHITIFALVGGGYSHTTMAGLWYWFVSHTASAESASIGARLIILITHHGIWCV